MAEFNLPVSLYAHLENSDTFYLLRVSMDGRYTYVNKAFASKFSFIAPDLVGLPFEATIHPDDLEACRQTAFSCIANPNKSIPVQLRKPDGAGGFFLSYYEFSALLNEAGEVAEVMCIGYDITENEAAQSELSKSSEKLDIVIENITDGFYIVDKDWRIIKANRVFTEIVGLPVSQILGVRIWDVLPKAKGDELYKYYSQAVRDNTTIRFEEYWPDINVWFERTVYPSAEGLTVLIKDVTERKQVEENIQEANNKLIAILNSTSDLNILINQDFKVISFNRVAAEFASTFFNREIAEGDSFWHYAPPGTEDIFRAHINEVLTQERSEFIQKLKFAPGVELWYKLRFFKVSDSEGNTIGVALSATNIDKEQQQYEKLEEIASLYASEVRKPVATIMGITQLIKEDELNTENRQWLGYLITTTHELNRVINRIMKKTNEFN
ncbi:PAS domain-containing protein [Cesiribacter sp. SM1]|uniref:PAS domain-containing protein n=1 Tax=Cesiribacter sp. SM1 TaxID=2861196 RepID=UPI001CD49352|nr:PAS domain-containing protein [Cesiribacter sp. SM1]